MCFFILFSYWKCSLRTKLYCRWMGTFLYQWCLAVLGQVWLHSDLTLHLCCTVNDFSLTFPEYGLNLYFSPTVTSYIFCSALNLATYWERNNNFVTHVIWFLESHHLIYLKRTWVIINEFPYSYCIHSWINTSDQACCTLFFYAEACVPFSMETNGLMGKRESSKYHILKILF